MSEKRADGKRRKLVWTMVALALVAAIALGVVYVNVSNSLNSAIRSALHTFAISSVDYTLAVDGAVDMNISVCLENPTTYVLKVEAITLSFWVGGKYIGSLPGIQPDHNLPSGEEVYFHFVRHLTDEEVINTLNKETYSLVLDGKISASATHLFVAASWERTIDYTREVSGIS